MTSESNKLLPLIDHKPRIGTQRPPNRRDLFDRRDPDTGARLQIPPDPPPEVALHRAQLQLGQTAIHMQQTIINMNPDSAVRDSLVVLADPVAASWSDSDWDTISDSTDGEAEMDEAIEEALKADLGVEREEGVEDAFIAKVRGVGADDVRRKRGKMVLNPMQNFIKKMRAVGQRGPIVATPAPAPAPEPARRRRRAPARTPAPAPGPRPARRRARAPVPARAPAGTRARPPAPQAAPVLTHAQPGTTVEMTAAEAALALTNERAGTHVIMEELRAAGEIDDLDYSADTYHWTVGGVSTRELTVAEAALVMTNMQAGTSVTMDDLRTSREMVDMWDCEDTFTWTVGNVE